MGEDRRAFVLAIGVVVIAAMIAPNLMGRVFAALLSVYFVCVLALRFGVLIVGWRHSRNPRAPSAVDIADAALPIYSILVPLYKESGLVAQIVGAIERLDWPRNRLDVQLLIEADDAPTLDAAYKIESLIPIRITPIKGTGPRTKPNALNVGLASARGRFLCIYDAEDRPHPQQLRAAFRVFRGAGTALAAVQAPLIGVPTKGSWIGSQWSLDYAVNFALLLPAYARLAIPIALGGTSNHFRTNTLRRLGGWDAWNVTEDADLGLRFARRGLEIGLVLEPTLEDPPDRYEIWLAQRIRWIKGFLITWLVLMRRPGQLFQELGFWRFLSLQLTFGAATFSPLFFAPATLLATFAIWADRYDLGPAGWFVLLGGFATSLMADLLAPKSPSTNRWLTAATRIFYWPLISIAAYGALIGLLRRPTYWAKTPHRPTPETPIATHNRLDP